MADLPIDVNSIQQKVAGGIDTTFTVIIILLIVAIVICIAAIIIWRGKFKHKFRIKEVIQGRKIYYDDVARDYKDKQGVRWWRLLKQKENVEIPPPEAIEIDTKGKKCVEAYRLETGEYIYIKDGWTSKEIPLNIQEVDEKLIPADIKKIEDEETRKARITEWRITKKAQQIKAWAREEKALLTYQPLNTNQRLLLIKQIEKANSRKKASWKDHIVSITAFAALTIIIVSLFIFWGDIAKPAIQAHQERLSYQVVITEQLQLIKEIKNDIQVIKDDQGINNNQPPG